MGVDDTGPADAEKHRKDARSECIQLLVEANRKLMMALVAALHANSYGSAREILGCMESLSASYMKATND